MVCFTFYFLELQISLTVLGITFFINIFAFRSFLFSLKLLAGRILGGLENTEVQLAYLVDFAQFLFQSALHFTFWHSILVLYYIGITFSMDVFLFLVPTAAYLPNKRWHSISDGIIYKL